MNLIYYDYKVVLKPEGDQQFNQWVRVDANFHHLENTIPQDGISFFLS